MYLYQNSLVLISPPPKQKNKKKTQKTPNAHFYQIELIKTYKLNSVDMNIEESWIKNEEVMIHKF